MPRFHYKLLLVFSILSVNVAQIAWGQSTLRLSWSESLKMATENNPELLAAKETLRAVELQENAALSGFLPQINASLSHSKTNSSFVGGGGGIPLGGASDTREVTMAQLNGTWNLFSGFQDMGRYEQAKANTRAQHAQLQSTKARISADLKIAYQGLLYAQSFVALTNEIVKRRQENLRLVELRYESGLENRGSVLLSQANYEQAKYDNIVAENAVRVSSTQLARVLGVDEAHKLEIYDPVPLQDQNPNAKPDFQKAVLLNPEVLLAEAQEVLAKQSLRVSRSTFMPSLNLTGSTGRMRVVDDPNDRTTWSIGLNLSFPLFNGGQDYYGIKASSAQLSAASSTLENMRRSVLAQIERAYATYVESIAKLRVDKSFRDATTIRSEISKKRYNNGLITFDDWNIIEDDLILRQKSYLQSVRERVVAEATYEQTLGQGAIQ